MEWTFRLRNNTNKKINYITLEWDCYNGVGDLIVCRINRRNQVRITYTGPLEAGKTTTRQKNMTRFYNSLYKKSSFTAIIVEFADGTRAEVDKYHYDVFS